MHINDPFLSNIRGGAGKRGGDPANVSLYFFISVDGTDSCGQLYHAFRLHGRVNSLWETARNSVEGVHS
ncbi:hypothetical protein AMECASPLE_038199 [Ameca splendens]|uniref:Uncharacterized protein n=1 Tax=Ameca splendens TaxID=208324 RepID=A0ABV1A4C1_9TELE